jgi:isoleucyl-tRNA synthetase
LGEGLGVRALNNNLDKWLISELNELTKEVSNGFNEYKLNEAAKPIVKFMDNLTNWYIRRSRKRFWKSENDGDKIEAYETLYYTLVEITKIIAPFMPFISEFMYKDLTGEKSVHLTDFPTYDENLINEQLNSDTDKVQKIITLGLAWRANNKIRVRQPLSSITITEQLDAYYTEIIKEELNVKQVLVVDGNSLAKQICKPNGRAI